MAIKQKLWFIYFPNEEDFTEEKAEELEKEVKELYDLFLKRGLSPIDENIQYFLNNCV